MKNLSRARTEVQGSTGRDQRRRFAGVLGLTLILIGVMTGPADATTTLPVLWTAGGHSAGADSAGQSARMAVDSAGNVTVVSGPGSYTALMVTSYTSSGELRWQRTVSPLSGTMSAHWVAAAPNGDVVALGSTADHHGRAYAITLVRFAADGTLLWRVDPSDAIYRSSVGRLVVDAAGSAYMTFNNQVAKYDSTGVLLWTQTIPAGFTTSLALGPDGSDVLVTGNFWGSFNSVIGSFDAVTGAGRWVATADEGSNDVVADNGQVYVTGQSYTGAGTPALAYFLTVVAYDRATGARLWRTDSNPGTLTEAVGQRIALGPDGSLVAIGYASGTGYLDWWIVALEANGALKWQTRRDRAPYPDEMPAVVFVLDDGTAVVSGLGGPLVGPTPTGMSYPQGVIAGYSPDGILLWEGFTPLPTVWGAALPTGDVCATGGYDALITCWQVPGAADYQPALTASPLSGTAPLAVSFTRSISSDPNGPVISYYTLDYGDGTVTQFIVNAGDGAPTFTGNSSHIYTAAGSYTATLTAFYSNAGSASDTVTVTVKPAVSTVMRITAINLSAAQQRNKVSVTGKVVVTSGSGAAISGAEVSATWAKPGGGTVAQTAITNASGSAKFSTSGGRGTYTLTVNNISKTGYSFDSANSVLRKSITK